MEVQPGDDTGEALAVATYVRLERGQWAVYCDVTFADFVRRFRVGTYRSERRASIQAEYVRRFADRPGGPRNLGF